jgi:Raf kinase inhibitor-like YbhB/YbcL family protein
MPNKFGGPAQCGGENVSPLVEWDNLPSGTKSVVVTLTDPNGPQGSGVTHWIAYNIPPATKRLKSGLEAGPDVTFWQNLTGTSQYRGACPPIGDTPHHYLLAVTDTDLAAAALPSGLDFKTLESQISGHTLGGPTIVGKYDG